MFYSWNFSKDGVPCFIPGTQGAVFKTDLSVFLPVCLPVFLSVFLGTKNEQVDVDLHCEDGQSKISFMSPTPGATRKKRRLFVGNLYIRTIILPRQARDKHRKS